jgi:class 3 adenylate cyclase
MLAAPVYSTLGIPLIPGAQRLLPARTTCATVLHADLHGYDALVERLAPLALVRLLEEFFAMLTNTVLECGGLIYHMAEADMLAGFGVGDSRHSQLHEGLAAACLIQQRFAPLRDAWQRGHAIDTGIGIGLHRGEVAVGVFGPSERTALTLVGDAAQLAAQLCQRARAGEVLMTAAAHLPPVAAAGSAPAPTLLHLPQLILPGRRGPIDAWCVPVQRRLEMRQCAERPGAGHRDFTAPASDTA